MLSPIGRFPNSTTPQSSNSQLPSLGSQSSSSNGGSYLGGVYGSSGGRVGMNNGSNSSLISPPLHSSASNTSFLSASSAPNGIAHHRLHSDSSLATLSSTGASSSTMSPRTPLNGPGRNRLCCRLRVTRWEVDSCLLSYSGGDFGCLFATGRLEAVPA